MPSSRIQLRDYQTDIVDYGSGSPVILIHSLGLDKSLWADVVPFLSSRARVITYDLRGHGRASPILGRHRIADFAIELALLLDYLKLPAAHLVGWSFGGAVAQQFAAVFPKRVLSIILGATVKRGLPVFSERAVAAQVHGLNAQISSTLARWFSSDSIRAEQPFVVYARQRLEALDIETWVQCWEEFANFTSNLGLLEPSTPIHLICGTEDVATPIATMKAFSDNTPRAQLHSIDGASHLAPLECPATAANVISEALNLPNSALCRCVLEVNGNPSSLSRLSPALRLLGVSVYLASNPAKAFIVSGLVSEQFARLTLLEVESLICGHDVAISGSAILRSLTAHGILDKRAFYLLPVTMPVPKNWETELDRWYIEEHVGLLLKSPAWQSVERYEVISASGVTWRRVMIHGLRSPNPFDDPDIKHAISTPWRNRLAENEWFRGARQVHQYATPITGSLYVSA